MSGASPPTRDRPAREPGGLECARCECIFIGEPWHDLCAVCFAEPAQTKTADPEGPAA